jgi:hypothetical protein
LSSRFIRRLARHLLDVDPSGRADHEHRALAGPVDDDAGIGLVLDVDRRGDQHLPNLEAL